jgi:hypothetical protein
MTMDPDKAKDLTEKYDTDHDGMFDEDEIKDMIRDVHTDYLEKKQIARGNVQKRNEKLRAKRAAATENAPTAVVGNNKVAPSEPPTVCLQTAD